MTKHRTITGVVAVALLAVAATAATMKSHSPWTDGMVASGTTSKSISVDANELAPADFATRWSALTSTTDTAERAPDAR
ncbi:hypothetical protein [Bradyrhizobium lablabi]|uniref:hypothetical protein n=1 Tax=Bradyrhizobium lablabi TaxID=722472 RepID=UPI001BA71919|nr:hypothetical protein [Bradyrhizobium lablabi]MBR0692958.1 hypothetical protein [Bradyrhizobium lablabi]